MRYASAAATLVVAAFFCFPLSAQQAPARTKQVITVRPVVRRYSVDTTTVTERSLGLGYSLSSGRTRLRLSGAPLGFTDGTTSIQGVTPPELALDVRLRKLDTMRVFIRGPSVPGSLTTRQVSALGSVGTATLDLESAAIGTPAVFGIRDAFAAPVGSAILGLRLGLEVEPRPGGTDSVYWRGTTVRAGASVTGFAGEFRITGGFDFAASFGDSLSGRNLFPGGGSFSLRADASGLVGSGATLANLLAFYFRPLGLNRPIQANRLNPTGAFMGATAGLLVPAGDVFVEPTLSLSRESSNATITPFAPGQGLRLTGTGWTLAGSLGVDVPLGRHLSFAPEAGFVGGSIHSNAYLFPTANRNVQGIPTASFADPVSGWWAALEVSASF